MFKKITPSQRFSSIFLIAAVCFIMLSLTNVSALGEVADFDEVDGEYGS